MRRRTRMRAFCFDPQKLYSVKRQNTYAELLICNACLKRPKYKCSIEMCRDKECYEWQFSEPMIKTFKKQKTGTSRLVCNSCCSLGFTTRRGGDQPRRCDFCWRHLGPQKFDTKHSSKKNKLMCNDCKTKPPCTRDI